MWIIFGFDGLFASVRSLLGLPSIICYDRTEKKRKTKAAQRNAGKIKSFGRFCY